MKTPDPTFEEAKEVWKSLMRVKHPTVRFERHPWAKSITAWVGRTKVGEFGRDESKHPVTE